MVDGAGGDDGGRGAMVKVEVEVEAAEADDGVDGGSATRNALVDSRRFAGLHSLSSCACG